MKNITTIHRRKTPDSFKLLPKVSRKTRKAIYLEASKYINDLTKLIFGGIILTNILNFIFKRKGVNYGICLFMYYNECHRYSFFYLAYDSKWSKMVA